jgi:hypothetical protein
MNQCRLVSHFRRRFNVRLVLTMHQTYFQCAFYCVILSFSVTMFPLEGTLIPSIKLESVTFFHVFGLHTYGRDVPVMNEASNSKNENLK